MIKLLLPLGLLGLLSIIVLIIIYIIKPNYQQKFISSTFIWQLSLKYRKKRIPVSKLRNILLVICQVLILTVCAIILSEPIVEAEQPEEFTEKIVIIDASASMWAVDPTSDPIYVDPITQKEYRKTRFQRAVEMVQEEARSVLGTDSGRISIIIAGIESYLLKYETFDSEDETIDLPIQRLGSDRLDDITTALDKLIEPDDIQCSFGPADIEGAMAQAETILYENPKTEVLLYTGTDYIDAGNVKVIDVKEKNEYNVAILGGTAKLNSKYVYTFDIEVASYGAPKEIELTIKVKNANATIDGEVTPIEDIIISGINCPAGAPQTISVDTYRWTEEAMWDRENGGIIYDDSLGEGDLSPYAVMTYEEVSVEITAVSENRTYMDSIERDNTFCFYGGTQPLLRIQYASSQKNPFVNDMISAWRSTFRHKWTLVSEEVAPDIVEKHQISTEGFDIYIFEHKAMPTKMPDDGIVIILDPQTRLPKESGLDVTRQLSSGELGYYTFYSDNLEHPIIKNIRPEKIEASRVMQVEDKMQEYTTLLYCDAYSPTKTQLPVLMVKNEPDSKVLMLAVDVNYSTFAMLYDAAYMFVDIFNYFLPVPMTQYEYEVGDAITFESLGSEVKYYGYDSNGAPEILNEFYEFPYELKLDTPGNYYLSQNLISKKEVETRFSVKVPASESNTNRLENILVNSNVEDQNKQKDLDLLLYFLIAIAALAFAEWWLQTRENF